MRVLKNKREIQNYKKLRVIDLFCYMWVFWCNTGVFPRSNKHFTLVGMLQSQYERCKVEWLLSTWKIPIDRRTGSHFHDCINFYDVAFSAIFNRVMGMRLHIFEISGVRKLWQVRIH